MSKSATMVREMRLNDGRILSPKVVHDGVVAHFQEFLAHKQVVALPDLTSLTTSIIFDHNNAMLCQLPSIHTVKKDVFFIPVNSSPYPEGFGSSFSQLVGILLKRMLLMLSTSFLEVWPCLDFFTDSTLVLIPKVGNPITFDKFRLISLCSVFYKVCSKILVDCLAPLLCGIIS